MASLTGGRAVHPGVSIRRMQSGDIDAIVRTFERWHKYRPQYEKLHDEQQRGERYVFVAWVGRKVVGYTTVVWRPSYGPFRRDGIPEVVDLNVITEFQKRGIGTALIAAAERLVSARGIRTIGIGVVQSEEYAAANRLYPRLGYTPDGTGVTTHDNELHLVKQLR